MKQSAWSNKVKTDSTALKKRVDTAAKEAVAVSKNPKSSASDMEKADHNWRVTNDSLTDIRAGKQPKPSAKKPYFDVSGK